VCLCASICFCRSDYLPIFLLLFSSFHSSLPCFLTRELNTVGRPFSRARHELECIPTCTCIVTLQCALLSIVRAAPLFLRATWSRSNLFVYCAFEAHITCCYLTGRESAPLTVTNFCYIFLVTSLCRAVVKGLCATSRKIRGFVTRWDKWIFSIYLILPAALGPWVH
jgi:hypothetical protein